MSRECYLEVFDYEFKEIFEYEGKKWFCAADICFSFEVDSESSFRGSHFEIHDADFSISNISIVSFDGDESLTDEDFSEELMDKLRKFLYKQIDYRKFESKMIEKYVESR